MGIHERFYTVKTAKPRPSWEQKDPTIVERGAMTEADLGARMLQQVMAEGHRKGVPQLSSGGANGEKQMRRREQLIGLVMDHVAATPDATARSVAFSIGMSCKSAQDYLSKLLDQGKLTRRRKTGNGAWYYRVVK